MKKMTRILPLVALVALIAAIPASTQVVGGDENESETSTNLPMLIAVNRLELTMEQMQQIHGLLSGLLETRDTQEVDVLAFEQAMIAFHGTAEELDELLEARRAEALESATAHREQFADVVDQIKGILTIKQGEALSGALGGLLAGPGMAGLRADSAAMPQMRGQIMMQGMGRMGRQMPDESVEMMQGRGIEDSDGFEMIRERMEERFGDRAGAMMEEMEDRMASRPGISETIDALRERMAERVGAPAYDADAGQGLRITVHGRMGAGSASIMGAGYGLDLIEQLVEVLELKLQAIE